MEAAVLSVARVLRLSGVPVSLTEIEDCLTGMEQLGLHKANVFAAMSATLVKRAPDLRLLEKVFHLYFDVFCNPSAAGPEENSTAGDAPGAADGRGLVPGSAGTMAEQLIGAVKSGSKASMERLAAHAVNRLGVLGVQELKSIGDTVRRAQVVLEWFMAWHLIGQAPDVMTEAVWEKRWSDMKSLLQEKVESSLVRTFGEEGLVAVVTQANLFRQEFLTLDEDLIPQIRACLQQMARSIAARPGYRMKRSCRGPVDLRKTVRNSCSSGGIPIRLFRHRRTAVRPELILLCDISRSVARFSQFMLQLVYAAQHRYRRVRSFVFVDSLQEVTNWFRTMELPEALGKVAFESRSSISGLSDFGRVFTAFRQQYLSALNRHTTIIILGDARNNWRHPNVDALKEIAGCTGRILWLNPVPRETWGTEDNIMHLYAPFCERTEECRNLEQLRCLSREIF